MLTRRAVLAAVSGGAPFNCLAQAIARSLEVPVRINAFGQISLPLGINGSPPAWCLLDTAGGARLAVTRRRATSLEVRGRATLSVGGIPIHNVPVAVTDRSASPDMVVGAGVFSSAVIELDFRDRAVRFHPPATFRYHGPGGEIPLEVTHDVPYVAAMLAIGGETIPTRLAVDTAAGGAAAYLSGTFDRELAQRDRPLPWTRDERGRAWCRIGALALGQEWLPAPTLRLLPALAAGADGLLGLDFLRRYRVFLDFRGKRMILEPDPARGTKL